MPGNELHIANIPCELVQIGVVVRDMDRTVKYLTEVFGLGPFQFVTYPPEGREDMQLSYRGEVGHFSHRLAYAQLGSIELELVQPLEGESLFAEFLREHGEGIQHIRFNTADLQPLLTYLSGKGVEPLMSGSSRRPGTRWVLMDTAAQAGFVMELRNVLPGVNGHTPLIADGMARE